MRVQASRLIDVLQRGWASAAMGMWRHTGRARGSLPGQNEGDPARAPSNWRPSIRLLLSTPVIYGMLVPLILIDVAASCYQHICFPIYRIARVPRSLYVVIDRHRLPYLNAVEGLNCAYCGYANGVLAYALEIASCTEQFFCPIKHARTPPIANRRHESFANRGDARDFRNNLPARRQALEATAAVDSAATKPDAGYF